MQDQLQKKTNKNSNGVMKVDLKNKNKVLLVTASTGLGFNYAPHFGMYQILNYLKL